MIWLAYENHLCIRISKHFCFCGSYTILSTFLCIHTRANVSAWNTGRVTLMEGLFKDSIDFDYTLLSNWNLSSTISLWGFMENATTTTVTTKTMLNNINNNLNSNSLLNQQRQSRSSSSMVVHDDYTQAFSKWDVSRVRNMAKIFENSKNIR